MVTCLKEILLNRIQVCNSVRMVGEREAEAAKFDGNWTKVKGGNAGVGRAGSERCNAKNRLKERTKSVLFHSKNGFPTETRSRLRFYLGGVVYKVCDMERRDSQGGGRACGIG